MQMVSFVFFFFLAALLILLRLEELWGKTALQTVRLQKGTLLAAKKKKKTKETICMIICPPFQVL